MCTDISALFVQFSTMIAELYNNTQIPPQIFPFSEYHAGKNKKPGGITTAFAAAVWYH